MTGTTDLILAAVAEVAKLGTGSLDFWKQLHETAAAEYAAVQEHQQNIDKEGPVPPPGPSE